MTLNGSTLCNIIQSFPVLLILAQNNNKCLKTPFIYKPPSPTHSPEYYEAYDALIQSLFSQNCDHTYPHYGHNSYGYGKKWSQDYTYYKPCNGHYPTGHPHPMLPHGYSYTESSYPHVPNGYAANWYPYGSKGHLNTTYVYKYVPNRVTNTKHKYKIVVLKNGRRGKVSEKLQRFFPQREERRQPFGFAQNFFPNPRRISQSLSGILHFRPGQDRNQQYNPFNNIPGITNNRPNFDQYQPNQNEFNQRPNNVRFPDGTEVPYDTVNFERPYPNEQEQTRPENPGFDANNGGFNVGNNDNSGLISGNDNAGPVFGNNQNEGLVSGNNENGPNFENNAGFVPVNVDRPAPSDGIGLISGSNDGPAFGNDGLISGNNDGPVFGQNDNRPVYSDGDTGAFDNKPTDAPAVVEEGGSIPVFVDRNGETDVATSTLPSLTPVPESEAKNLNFLNQGVFKETCQTVDGDIGSCISIKACEPYVKLLQQSQSNPQVVRVLRGAHCGFDGDNPKVCCPRPGIPDAPPAPIPTQAPTPAPVPTVTPRSGDFLSALPEPPVCGESNATLSRVVGGINAKLGDFPWMALLGYKTKRDGSTRWLCGGSIISSRHILTAAHCIHNHETDLYVVRVGELDLSREDEGATPIDVLIKSKAKHEAYDPKAFTNDIGILLLQQDIQFTNMIRPICMPKETDLRARSFENYNPLIAGWGDTEFRGPSAPHLQVLQLPVVSNEFCAKAYSQYKTQVIDQRVLCAGFKNGGKDACQGDSGGPLMQPIYNKETYKTYFYQIGVVSFGKRCAEAGFPGVYTRVTEFVPWIQKIVLGTSS